LSATGRIIEAGCCAHVRRKFFDVHAAAASPVAKKALDRIGQLYAVEATINGSARPAAAPAPAQIQTDRRGAGGLGRRDLPKLSRKSELAAAFRLPLHAYMRARWTALCRCFEDGHLRLDNNRPSAPCALRRIALAFDEIARRKVDEPIRNVPIRYRFAGASRQLAPL
jgi:hypothetical protein